MTASGSTPGGRAARPAGFAWVVPSGTAGPGGWVEVAFRGNRGVLVRHHSGTRPGPALAVPLAAWAVSRLAESASCSWAVSWAEQFH